MALHFYLGATSGNADGTLISSGDNTAPVVFDGMYPATGSWASKTVSTIAIRADSGEVWRRVHVTLQFNDSATSFQYASITASSAAASQGVYYTYGSYMKNVLFIKKVTDVNIMLTVSMLAYGSDTSGSPDTNIKLVAWGDKQ